MGLPNPIPTAKLDLPVGGLHQDFQYIPAPRLAASQDVSYNASGGAQVLSTAFGITTSMIQITAPPSTVGSGVRIIIGYGPTVTATSPLIIPGSILYYRVYPGEQLAAVSNDANTGSINIVECATVPNP